MPVKKKMKGKGMKMGKFEMPTFSKPKSPTRVAPAPVLTRVPAVKKGIQVKGMTRAVLKRRIETGERMIDMKEGQRQGAEIVNEDARKKGAPLDSDSRSVVTSEVSGKVGLDSARENLKLEKEELKRREEADTVAGKFKKMLGSGGELTKIESSIKKLRVALKKKK